MMTQGAQNVADARFPVHSNHKQEIKKKIGGLGHHYGGAGLWLPKCVNPAY